MGEQARLAYAALEALGAPLATLTVPAPHVRQEHAFADLKPVPGLPNPYDVNLVVLNPPALRRFAGQVGPGFFAGRYTVGYWAWETAEFPEPWLRALELVDEVWMVGEHAASGLRPRAHRPVEVFPIPVRIPAPATVRRETLGLPEGFLFLFIFDYGSDVERKNPAGVLRAFTRAFAPGEGPLLALKSINEGRAPSAREQLRREAGSRHDILLLEGYLAAARKDMLMAAADCYVSLHRAEGFGITLAEAMALGKPVIATGYSGNLEFMTPDNSYLVGWSEVEVPAAGRRRAAGARWAEPDTDEAAALMRRVYQKPEEARQVGEAARADLARLHGPEARARLLGSLLERIRSERMGQTGIGAGGKAVAWQPQGGPMADDADQPVAVPAQAAEIPGPGAGQPPGGGRKPGARLEKVRRERDDYKRQVQELRAQLLARPPGVGAGAGGAPPGKVLLDQEGYEELRQAKRDLVRLLRRLGRPPLGWLLRRQSGYRRLRQRWLREG
ncbi:MAG: glycosyltransferase family 4 protein [Acidimicrobiia bacterium]|nr:glycosyltransferase family 4 protein [Acidimicrobiia bacterium]